MLPAARIPPPSRWRKLSGVCGSGSCLEQAGRFTAPPLVPNKAAAPTGPPHLRLERDSNSAIMRRNAALLAAVAVALLAAALAVDGAAEPAAYKYRKAYSNKCSRMPCGRSSYRPTTPTRRPSSSGECLVHACSTLAV